MKAMVVRPYGGPEVIELAELPTPAPREREVLVRMEAASATSSFRSPRP